MTWPASGADPSRCATGSSTFSCPCGSGGAASPPLLGLPQWSASSPYMTTTENRIQLSPSQIDWVLISLRPLANPPPFPAEAYCDGSTKRDPRVCRTLQDPEGTALNPFRLCTASYSRLPETPDASWRAARIRRAQHFEKVRRPPTRMDEETAIATASLLRVVAS